MKATISLPYMQGVSEALKRVQRSFHIGVVIKPYQTLMRKLVHPKDTISELERSNIVYCIPCADCSSTYVGETKGKLGKRLDEHRRVVQKGRF